MRGVRTGKGMKELIGEYFVGMQMLSIEHIEKIMDYQKEPKKINIEEHIRINDWGKLT